MPLTSSQVGDINKAYILDDFITSNGSATPNNMYNRFPDYFRRDPAFYIDNTTYDPRYNNYNIGNLFVDSGNLGWVTNTTTPTDYQIVTFGSSPSFGANYLQVNEAQRGELSTSYGGNIIWKMLDLTVDLSYATGFTKIIPLMANTRESIQATDRDNPGWRAQIEGGGALIEVMPGSGLEWTGLHAQFTAGLIINNSNPLIEEFLSTMFGYVPKNLISISCTGQEATGVGDLPENAVGGVTYWANSRIIPIDSEVVSIYVEATTHKASGVQYEILVNGSPANNVQVPWDLVLQNVGELPPDAKIRKSIATPNRLSIRNRRFEYNWYDNDISYTLLSPAYAETIYHKAGIGIGSDAGFYNGNTGWKVGAI